MKSNFGFRLFKYFDWQLTMAALALCFIGLIAIYATGQINCFTKQIFSLVAGVVIYFIVSAFDYRVYKKYAELFYAATVFLLIAVINMGYESYGAQRWIQFMGFSFQPSEFAKLSLIIVMAKFLEIRQAKLNSIIEIIPSLILVGVPFFIIFKQPDLGSAIVLLVIFLIMSVWAGMKISRLFLLASPLLSIVALYAIPLYPLLTWTIYLLVIFVFLMQAKLPTLDFIVFYSLNVLSGVFSPFLWNSFSLYQKNRIISFINPDSDPLARGIRYHTVKSVIAVGSGGFWGKGFMQGPLTNLQYIPQQHTDFIFSVIAEEFGLWGSLLVIGLMVFVLYRLIIIALQASTVFGKLIVIGTTTFIMFHFFINIGMNIGIVPVVGLPLPFISYGGSALISFLVAIGLAQSVAMHRGTIIF